MVYAWCLERIPQEKVEEWIFMLNQPLPGEDPKNVTPSLIEDEGASFMALFNAQQGSA